MWYNTIQRTTNNTRTRRSNGTRRVTNARAFPYNLYNAKCHLCPEIIKYDRAVRPTAAYHPIKPIELHFNRTPCPVRFRPSCFSSGVCFDPARSGGFCRVYTPRSVPYHSVRHPDTSRREPKPYGNYTRSFITIGRLNNTGRNILGSRLARVQ